MCSLGGRRSSSVIWTLGVEFGVWRCARSQLAGLPDVDAEPETEVGEAGHAEFGAFEDEHDKVGSPAVLRLKPVFIYRII